MVGEILNYRYRVIGKEPDEDLFAVYKCEDLIGKRTVTAKILLPQFASNRAFAERILKDAEALEPVIHPGIVRVFEHGEENGRFFVITEFVSGIGLDAHIRKSAPYAIPIATDIGAAICGVLDYMHNHGFIHGDLRPANIMVTQEGQIKIANFWLSGAVASSQSIRTNALMRSIHYMSPETANGQPATAASDVYSLGVILFQLLTGSLPFDGDTPIAIAIKHAEEPIPNMQAQNPSIPRNLESITARAMQKSPGNRFGSAKAMLQELSPSKNLARDANPTPESRPAVEDTEYEEYEADPPALTIIRRVLLVFVLLILVVAAGVGAYLYTRPTDVIVPDLIGKTQVEAQTITLGAGLELSARPEQYNEEFPEGTIYFTSPVSGRTTKRGSTIEIWLSKGSKYAQVPDLSDISNEDAQRKIMTAGLAVGEVSEEYSDSISMGNVIKQKPKPSTKLDRDSKVDLTYSLGPKTPETTSITTEETPTPENTTNQSSSESRSFNVKFKVPPGADPQNVEIAVVDDYGENIVYTETKSPGETVEQTVEGVGKKVKIRIYIDGKLAKEERK